MNAFDRINAQWRRHGRNMLALEANDLQSLVVGTVLALPIALLWADGILSTIGFLYLIAYTTAMLVPTALFVLIGFDALRVLFHRQAIFLPLFLATAEKVGTRTAPLSIKGRVLYEVLVAGNLIGTISRELWLLAARLNPAGAARVLEDARRLHDGMPKDPSVTREVVGREAERVIRVCSGGTAALDI